MNLEVYLLLLLVNAIFCFTLVQKYCLYNINMVYFFEMELATTSDNFIAKFHKIRPFFMKKVKKFSENVPETHKTIYISILYLTMSSKITKI